MSSELSLPGFRFHPTEEELLNFYLKNTLLGKNLHSNIIGTTNIYRHDPWDLPGLANIGEREWYFLVPRDRKQGAISGGRPTRTTENGFWKATGTDRRILNSSDPNKGVIGLRKTLVFYRGRAPRGCKTDWIMNEYRHPDSSSLPKDMVLCKIYRKATSMKVLEQRAATTKTVPACPSAPASTACIDADLSCSFNGEEFAQPVSSSHGHQTVKEERYIHESMVAEDANIEGKSTENKSFSSSDMSRKLLLPAGSEKVLELQMPNYNKFTMDWTQESSWTQLGSPWLFNLTPTASILNF